MRWGILGAARITRSIIPALRAAAGHTLDAIASRDADKAAAAAAEWGIPRSVAGYDALLADPDIDAVYIPLPNHLHAEWTIRAAEAGKHVLCEKPLALSAADAERMAAVCADAGVVLMEAFMYRHHPTWVKVRELVAEGRIGELVGIQSFFGYFNDDPANIRNIAEAGG